MTLLQVGGPEYTLELDSCDVIWRLWRCSIQIRARWLYRFAVLNAYLDVLDKGSCVNILEVWHSKYILNGKILLVAVKLQRHEL